MKTTGEQRRRALLAQAKQVIHMRYAELDLALDDVAAAVGSSRRQVQRVFADVQGEAFRDFLLRVRMERARALLSHDGRFLSVSEVAARVGYRQASGLRQAFIRFWGVAPTAMRPDSDPDAQFDIE